MLMVSANTNQSVKELCETSFSEGFNFQPVYWSAQITVPGSSQSQIATLMVLSRRPLTIFWSSYCRQ